MGVELDVWAEHKIDFGTTDKALDFGIQNRKKIAHRSRTDRKQIKETLQIEKLNTCRP